MSRLVVYQESVNLITETCATCGILFAMPEDVQKRRRTKGGSFYCPNGHGMSYTKPTVTALKEQLEEAERKMRAAKCEALNAQAKQAEAEKALARQTKRVRAGVCPCCNRSFQNLSRHMATKHKEAQP